MASDISTCRTPDVNLPNDDCKNAFLDSNDHESNLTENENREDYETSDICDEHICDTSVNQVTDRTRENGSKHVDETLSFVLSHEDERTGYDSDVETPPSDPPGMADCASEEKEILQSVEETLRNFDMNHDEVLKEEVNSEEVEHEASDYEDELTHQEQEAWKQELIGACAPEPPDPPDEVLQQSTELSEEEDDDFDDAEWCSQQKHIFILSEAGKPIYSRYGCEERMVTLFGVMQAIVSCVADGEQEDEINSIEAGNKQYVFLHRRPLILVAVIKHKEPFIVIKRQLHYVHGVIVTVLTDAQIGRIFEQRANYDLRRLLGGADRLIENLLRFTESEPGTWMSSVPCLPVPAALRDHIKDAIVAACSKIKTLVFALLIAENHLVMLVRMKKYNLHSSDLHLIMNLVSSSESFKQSENWTPICLPSFDPSGFMHVHVSYLSEECHACLLLFNTDRDAFFGLSQAKQQIVQRLHHNGSLEALQDCVELFKHGVRLEEMGFLELRHLIYKQNPTQQHICSAIPNPYKQTEKDSWRLMMLYRLLHTRVHSSRNPLKIYFVTLPTESMLAWVTSGFELYATFEPLVTKNTAVNCVARVIKWVKKEEDRFFMPSIPNF